MTKAFLSAIHDLAKHHGIREQALQEWAIEHHEDVVKHYSLYKRTNSLTLLCYVSENEPLLPF